MKKHVKADNLQLTLLENVSAQKNSVQVETIPQNKDQYKYEPKDCLLLLFFSHLCFII